MNPSKKIFIVSSVALLCVITFASDIPKLLGDVAYTEPEDTECLSSDECPSGYSCSTENGECNTPSSCNKDEPCLAVCSGFCEADGFIQPSLESSLVVQSSYTVTKPCTDAPCPLILWLNVADNDGTPIKKKDNISLRLYPWNETIEDYDSSSFESVAVYTPDQELASMSFEIPNLESKLYPASHYFLLKFALGDKQTVWTVILTQKTIESSVESTVSKPDDIKKPTKKKEKAIDAPQPLPTNPDAILTFNDVLPYTPIGIAASNLAAKGIINGYPDGSFKPLNFVNRAEAAKFLLLSRYGAVADTKKIAYFPDVDVSQWYAPYVLFAAEQNIINGYPNGTFQPGSTVNTVEFLKMLTLTFELDQNLPHQFIDVENDDWFTKYVGIVNYYKLLPKRPSYALYPDMNMTREEVALAIHALLQRIEK